MPTIRQRQLAENIVKNVQSPKKKNKRELVVSSGYSEISADSSSHIILEQKGVKEALEDLGFTEDNAKRVVGEILLNSKVKPDTRINAAKEVFKVHGSYKNGDEGGNKTLIINIVPETAQRYAIPPRTEDNSTGQA